MKLQKKNMLRRALLLAAAGFSLGGVVPAFAEETAITSVPVYYDLSEVVVDGRRYIRGQYIAATNHTGILGETDPMKSPVSVNTISQKAVEDFTNPTEGLASMLTLSPSVQYAGNPAVDQVNIRGFAETGRGYNINGIPGMSDQNRQTMNYIDSVDVIEGPTAGITGVNAVADTLGGTVNINSKRAGETPLSKVGLAWYSKGAFEQSIDVGKRFGSNGEWGVRVNAMNVNGERGIDNWDLKQKDVYVNIDHKTDKSKTNFLVGYVDTDSEGRPAGVELDTSVTKLPDPISGNKNPGPSWRQDKYKQYIFTLNHEQRLNDHLTAFLNAGHYKEDWYYYLGSGSVTLLGNDGTYSYLAEKIPLLDQNDYIQLGLKGNFETGPLHHAWVASVDRHWQKSWFNDDYFAERYYGNLHGSMASDWLKPDESKFTPYYGLSWKYRMSGWTLMDTITNLQNKLTVLVGVTGKSYDETDYADRYTAVTGNKHSYAISPSYAINYEIKTGLAVYAAHTEQFQTGPLVPNDSSKYTNPGQMLDPGKTKQNEFGIKFKGGNFLHKLSYFDIKQPGTYEVPSVDGKKVTLTLDGEDRHKGLEYSIAGSLNEKWNLVGGFMYLDTDQVKNGPSNGKHANGVPEWTASLGAEYVANDAFSILTRFNYVGSSYIQNEKFKVPGYFRMDLGARYKTEIGSTPVTLRAMCYNLFDKKYWQPLGNTLYVGSGRTFTLAMDFSL